MKKLLAGLGFAVGLAIAAAAWAQSYYNIYGPVSGVQYNTGATPFNTAATAAQIASPFGCSGSQALTGTGGCSATGGTVTSVGLTVPSWETVSGSPVTSSGTLAITAATGQTANQFLATPNGSTGAVSLRAIAGADVPPINLASTANGGVLNSSILPGANGGTGNGFFAVSGPTTSLKTFTFPNASATVLTTNAAVTAVQGGTGLTSYALGDTLYASAANTLSALAGNTTSTKKFYTQTGTGTVSAAPSWATIAAGDIPSLGANPSATIGLTAVNGVATTYMTSDSAPALSQAISPTWSGTHTFSNAITVNGGGSSLKGGVSITVPTSGSTLSLAATGGSGTAGVGITATSTNFAVLEAAGNGNAIGTTGTYVGQLGDSRGALVNRANADLILGTNNATRVTVGNAGNVSVAAPASGTAVTVTGLSGSPTLNVAASSGAASSVELGWNVGITASQWNLFTQSTDALVVGTTGNAGLSLGTNSAQRLTINGSGAITINTPSSATALTVNGTTSQVTQLVQAATGSGVSFGLRTNAGTTSADYTSYWGNASTSTEYMRLYGDGGLTVGTPTGSDKGVGTLNTAGTIYTNNVGLRMASISATCTSGGCSVHSSTTANGVSTSITRSSVGSYSITFSPSFATLGGCSATVLDGAEAPIANTTFIGLTAISSSGVSIGTSQNGVLTDENWSIVCNGT